MITVYQGTQSQINARFLQLKAELPNPIVLYEAGIFPTGWTGMRQIASHLRRQHGNEAVNAVLKSDVALCPFIFPEENWDLDESAQNRFNLLKARYESRLNVPYTLYEYAGRMLGRLAEAFEFTLLMPQPDQLDSESLRIVENCYRFLPETRQNSHIGFATNLVDQVDADGITWNRSQGTVQHFVGSLLMHPGTSTVAVEGEGMDTDWGIQAETDLESALYERLANGQIGQDAAQEALAELYRAYERFSFRAVIRLGVRLLAVGTDLSPVLRSQVHGLIGSAGTFYQFSHHGNPPFDIFLVHHLSEALKHEPVPAYRSALFYRITFSYAERMEDLENALLWAEKGVAEANAHEIEPVAYDYHRSWAHNVRSYVYAVLDRWDDAISDVEHAFSLLQSGIERMEAENDPAQAYWLNDYRLSRFNLVIHQVYDGDELDRPSYSQAWFPRVQKVMADMPRLMYFDTFHWIDYHRNKLALNDGLAAAEEGIRDADTFFHGQKYVYAFCAGDLAYRAGKAEESQSYFEMAKSLRPDYNDLFWTARMDWFIAAAAFRQGNHSEAEAYLLQELESAKEMEMRIRVSNRLILTAAGRGERDLVSERVNETVDLAVELGELNLLIKVAGTAGRASHMVGDDAAAAEAYGQALELVDAAENTAELNQLGLLELYTGILLIHGYNEGFVAKALSVLKGGLDDLDGWWCLPQLAAHVARFRSEQADVTQFEAALQLFDKAVQERADCQTILNTQ